MGCRTMRFVKEFRYFRFLVESEEGHSFGPYRIETISDHVRGDLCRWLSTRAAARAIVEFVDNDNLRGSREARALTKTWRVRVLLGTSSREIS